MAYEIAEAARAALKDGQNMESALKDRKKDIEGMQSEIDWANEQIEAMQAHARRLRISQLRRMEDSIWSAFDRSSPKVSDKQQDRHLARLRRFGDACLAEIERLRGEE